MASAFSWATSCISNVSFWASLKILTNPAKTFANGFCTVAIFKSIFFCTGVIIIHNSWLTRAIFKSQLLDTKNFFTISFKVVFLSRDFVIRISFYDASHLSLQGRLCLYFIIIFLTLSKIKLLTVTESSPRLSSLSNSVS